jgi:MFS family permease
MKLDRLPIMLCAALCAALAIFISLAPPASEPADRVAFGASLARATAQERRVLLPLGVATSIATILVLLRHGALRSRRGRLQAAAVLTLFGSGLFSLFETQPIAQQALRALGGEGAVASLLARLRVDHWMHLGCAASALVCLVTASRQPHLDDDAAVIAGLEPRHRLLLFLLGTATLFRGYDNFIVSMALPYIGRDLGASERALAAALSVIRVGALISVALGYAADRRGRRGILVATILAYTVATAATGLSTSLPQFVAFQLFAEIFLVAELALAQVVIAEEFPATARSLGQGLLGTFGALGAGMAALLFPLFQESAAGWRGLYFVGLAPLLLVAYLRRSLPETTRWQAARAEPRVRASELARGPLRRRFAVLLALGFALGASAAPAFSFASYRAAERFAWSPSQVSAMVLFGGGVGMLGWFLSGILGERIGRRTLGVAAFAGVSAACFAYYASRWLAPAFTALVFFEAGATVSLNALGTELFPTSLRAAAKSWITNAGVVGSVAGMAAVAALGDMVGGADAAIRLLSCLPLLASTTMLTLPETRGLELEEIVVVTETVTSISPVRARR